MAARTLPRCASPVALLASRQPPPLTHTLHPAASQAASVSDYTYPSPAESIHRRDDEEEDSEEEEEAGLAREDEADEVRRDLAPLYKCWCAGRSDTMGMRCLVQSELNTYAARSALMNGIMRGTKPAVYPVKLDDVL